jgi:hypothetical protein
MTQEEEPAMSADLPPIRAITTGPKYHWFGYYDKLQFDPTSRFVLGMEVDFHHRSPTADDAITVGVIDLEDRDRWTELGKTRAWCWQQGCMLQWRPGSTNEVVWNDRDGDQFHCRILNIETGQERTLPHPIYTLSPDGKMAVAPDFRRINDMRPGYGYAGPPDPHAAELAPDDAGIWGVDLDTGESTLLVSLAQMAAIDYPHADLTGVKHYFNHLLFNTDGTRFEFLNRWRGEGMRGFGTRMMTAALDGSDIQVVDDYGHTSHFIWRGPTHILAWSWHPSHEGAFYLYEDHATNKVEAVGLGVMLVNGHCTYLPGDEWILNDTYPDEDRLQHLYVYNVAQDKRIPLADLYAPPEFNGEWRCDLHPRYSPDGRLVTVDSAHVGDGRQIYLVDIGEIVG